MNTVTTASLPIDEAQSLLARLRMFTELANAEKDTAARLKHFLTEYKPTRIVDHVGGYGIIAEWSAGGKGPTVMVRASMDATADEHRRGNDGHMAMVAALAPLLHEQLPDSGSVVLLFQPASSTGTGARSVYLDDKFRPFKPDLLIGFHAVPGHELGSVLFRDGGMTTASKGLTIKLHGKSNGISTHKDAIHPLGGLIRLAEQIRDLEEDDKFEEYVQTNIAHAKLGDSTFHTSPDYAELSATIRAEKRRELDKMAKRIVDYAQIAGQIHQLGIDVTWHDAYEAVKNPEETAALLQKWTQKNEIPRTEMEQPFRWSDDFGVYQENLNAIYFGLGCGLSAGSLGSPDFSFPEELLAPGIQALWTLVNDSHHRLDK